MFASVKLVVGSRAIKPPCDDSNILIVFDSKLGVFLKYIVFVIFMLCGCTSIDYGTRGTTHVFAGIVRVNLPATSGKLTAIEVRSFGAGWDNGPYLGWKANSWVIADPDECQLLIVIRSPAQAENAAKVIQALGGQNACIADFTHTLQP